MSKSKTIQIKALHFIPFLVQIHFCNCKVLYRGLQLQKSFLMKNHRFILEPYKGKNSRHICPNCGDKAKTFTLYIDIESNESIAPIVGRCGRAINCSYHYTPKEYFAEHQDRLPKELSQWRIRQRIKPYSESEPLPSLIPVEHLRNSLRCYNENNFVQFLWTQFGETTTKRLIEDYCVGTSKYWNGATVFFGR